MRCNAVTKGSRNTKENRRQVVPTAQYRLRFGSVTAPPADKGCRALVRVHAAQAVVATQFIVGLAHLEGYGVEKDERSAYYWLRMAEENSCTIRHRSHALVEELRSIVKTDDIEAVEDDVAIRVQENELLRLEANAR